MNIEPIAFIENDFKEKFGVPRQSGLVSLPSRIVLEPKFRDENALRGLEDFTHIWLIWGFSEAKTNGFSPTVRPPRLGGNVRKGVFATRSPFRPNSLGLSVVKLVSIDGFALTVTGADLMNGTPIYDIKPYLPYADSVPEASNGWSLAEHDGRLTVEFHEELLKIIPEDKRQGLLETLAQDPRPQYQSDERVYTMAFGDWQVSFTVNGDKLLVKNVK
ncbi:MAG: tRNA (N6-threonylcarbamoyladenosine(37)-N6)-methyltransferase TrmO [Ruminococcaceae bacterium]|nr:tRNA (N6-threonylcarbamoyladenosine(37)-N6)-methyltransferase TrmO [Oscillospiraceae bacterium]